MHGNDNPPPPDLRGFLELESRVWQALAEGDAAADTALLTADFLGVYPSGYSDRAGHAGQLDQGPTTARYQICEARLRMLSDDLAMLSYRAEFTRAATGATPEAMYVTSIWQREGGHWRGIFSQDTPAED